MHTETKDLQIQSNTKMRGQLQCKQILLDSDDMTREQIKKLTPKEILSKANLRLEKLSKNMADDLQEDANEKLDDVKFMAAQILKNRGVLLKMVTENGAKWLKQKKISKGFEWCFPWMVTIKGKTYQVVIQFLPTRL